ncbi:uncharacterized protein LOC115626590 [Scaptodrosophila lebanonensis]|uniref:Uncharacterized protein LOC115626590 n=1 Tax=Drosophila lebanonensis TaxID=7225 RepID=A0A6J2TRU1_DROLE|nr:uncharacterized protein LOC115626590 [Scaptodrosophila lebanonensis]
MSCFWSVLLISVIRVQSQVLNYQDTVVIGNQTLPKAFEPRYDVNTEMCQMPYVAPETPQIRALRPKHRSKLRSCKSLDPLVTVSWNPQHGRYQLNVQKSVARQLLGKSAPTTLCQYQQIQRGKLAGKKIDNGYRLLHGIRFKNHQLVPPNIQSMLIQCEIFENASYVTDRLLFKDGLAFVQPKFLQLERQADAHRQPSVVMIGIDSMSRANMRRTLPRVSRFLSGSSNWHELQGFNKVGDNTFPNLLATLTGHSMEDIVQLYCDVNNQTHVGCMDSLPFVWKNFKYVGYTTAMAEDCVKINTFNNYRLGFKYAPVDHYLRPFLLALENHLPKFDIRGFNQCLGHRPGMQYIFEYCAKFVQRYLKKQPMFGFFWTNSFSSADYIGPSAYDQFLYNYLTKFEAMSLYNESIVIVFSDHGMRYGNLIRLPEGQLEERLPMLFISLPPWFKRQYPRFASALQTNRNRLSSHFDLYMTLKHLTMLPVATDPQLLPTPSCKYCQSLFYELPKERRCQDAGIKAHWCACENYELVPLSSLVQDMCHFVVGRINQLLASHNLTKVCSPLRLFGIKQSQRKRRSPMDPPDVTFYRVRLEVLPNKAMFEATLQYREKSQTMDMDMDFSRLTTFSRDSNCIHNKNLKKYCVCYKNIKIN